MIAGEGGAAQATTMWGKQSTRVNQHQPSPPFHPPGQTYKLVRLVMMGRRGAAHHHGGQSTRVSIRPPLPSIHNFLKTYTLVRRVMTTWRGWRGAGHHHGGQSTQESINIYGLLSSNGRLTFQFGWVDTRLKLTSGLLSSLSTKATANLRSDWVGHDGKSREAPRRPPPYWTKHASQLASDFLSSSSKLTGWLG
jgi:hypothetical protein